MNNEGRKPKVYTALQAQLKAESFCAYQERAQQEVRDKLYQWGLHQEDVENVISNLIENNFINEERFAKSYVLGKFRIKGWGKVKISQHLKSKQISKPLIRIALAEIDLDDYSNKINDPIQKKINKNISDLTFLEKSKLIRFLQSRGYELDLIYEHINQGLNK
ncbi:MAG: regulatory protein RecX [Sphingobacterium sp.]